MSDRETSTKKSLGKKILKVALIILGLYLLLTLIGIFLFASGLVPIGV